MNKDFDERLKEAERKFNRVLSSKKAARQPRSRKTKLSGIDESSFKAIESLARDIEEAGLRLEEIIDSYMKD